MSMLPLAITFFHYQALFASMGFPWHALPSWGTFHSHGCVQTINDILTQKRSVRFVLLHIIWCYCPPEDVWQACAASGPHTVVLIPDFALSSLPEDPGSTILLLSFPPPLVTASVLLSVKAKVVLTVCIATIDISKAIAAVAMTTTIVLILNL